MKHRSAVFFSSVLMIAIAPNVNGHEHFESYTWTDDFTAHEIFSRFSHNGSIERGNFASFGLQCLIPSSDEDKGFARLFFTDLKGFGVPYQDVLVKINIDNKYKHEFIGKMSDGSFLSGYVDDIPSDFYTHIKSGENIFVHSYVSNKLESKNKFSLSGASEAVESVENKCNISLGASAAVLKQKELIRERYNKKIAKLKEQMHSELAKVL